MDVVLIRLVNMSQLDCSHTLTGGPTGGSTRLEGMGFKRMFLHPHCRFIGFTGGSGFIKINRHEFQQDVLRSSM